ncbi:MAG TPA: T9SS type A sorting domain-containing protein, partial [Bacteroidales bacterium]|nr:T9SS type A sorting domain-containing protein [Bacteroidales bacterium]
YVLINNTYSNNQITIGIATFDALDASGNLYETASSARFEADHLTSLPINLNFSAADSVFMSFYFQPGGLADLPEDNDSLTLQFYAPAESKWYSVWKAKGGAWHNFKAVILKVDQERYLQKGFKFRFINYVTLSANVSDPSIVGNCDIWNIDYVLLNKNRNSADTVFHDVAFRRPLRSLLKTYEAMPFKQFRQIYLQEMSSVIPIHYRNNDIITRNITRDFEIRDVYKNSLVKTFSAGAVNIAPETNEDFNADLIYTYDTDIQDSALFKVKAWLKTDVFDPKQNDTLVYYQVFNNYFAYDDGSAEEGYGINGLGSRNARVACRFKSYMEDTLRAISICFNDSYLDANKRAFDLMVWGDNNGIPGDLLYTRENVTVEKGNSINGFYTYPLTSPVPVNGVFYVGWQQRSETFLNAGFDINTLSSNRQFYWINGNWNQSVAPGTIMIRPVEGSPLTTSVNDIEFRKTEAIRFWPNPSSDYITIDPESLPVSGLTYISIADMQGRILIKVPYTGRVDISYLHDGIYILILSRNGVQMKYARLVKTN